MKKQSADPISDLLKKLNLEPTRENYLAIDRWEPNPQLTGEEEMELPPQFRLRPLKNVPLCSKHVQRVIPLH